MWTDGHLFPVQVTRSVQAPSGRRQSEACYSEHRSTHQTMRPPSLPSFHPRNTALGSESYVYVDTNIDFSLCSTWHGDNLCLISLESLNITFHSILRSSFCHLFTKPAMSLQTSAHHFSHHESPGRFSRLIYIFSNFSKPGASIRPNGETQSGICWGKGFKKVYVSSR